jgi:hypothetical protein
VVQVLILSTLLVTGAFAIVLRLRRTPATRPGPGDEPVGVLAAAPPPLPPLPTVAAPAGAGKPPVPIPPAPPFETPRYPERVETPIRRATKNSGSQHFSSARATTTAARATR